MLNFETHSVVASADTMYLVSGNRQSYLPSNLTSTAYIMTYVEFALNEHVDKRHYKLFRLELSTQSDAVRTGYANKVYYQNSAFENSWDDIRRMYNTMQRIQGGLSPDYANEYFAFWSQDDFYKHVFKRLNVKYFMLRHLDGWTKLITDDFNTWMDELELRQIEMTALIRERTSDATYTEAYNY